MPSIFPRPTSPSGAASQPQGTPGDAIPNALSYRHPLYYAQIETAPGSNSWSSTKELDWREVVLNQDGQDDSAQFVIGMLDSERAYNATPIAWDFMLQRLLPDRRLRVVSGVGDGTVLFQGYPMVSSLAWQPGSHSMAVTAISEGQERMRTGQQAQVHGRFMRAKPWTDWDADAPDHRQIDAMPVAFNEGGTANRSPDLLPFDDGDGGTAGLYLFTENDADNAAYWTFGQALRYLMFHHVVGTGAAVSAVEFLADTDAIADAVDGMTDTDPLLSKLNARVPDVSVESLTVDEAVRVLTGRAGLHYRWAIAAGVNAENNQAKFRLRVYATIGNSEEESATDPNGNSRMGAPKAMPLRRQAPFTDVSADTPRDIAEANRIQAASVIRDGRGFNTIRARGGIHEYEVGVILRPGWLPSEFLDNVTDTGAGLDAAVDYWGGHDSEFDPEYTRGILGNQLRIPTSTFHSLHPAHGTALDPNPADASYVSKVSDVFRLWVFPDSHRYMREGSSDYARPAASLQNTFDADWYKPFDPASEVSIWADIVKGAGLGIDVVEHWVPRYRPFANLIGRRNISSTDQSPIVLVNFTDTNITAAANGLAAPAATTNWVEFSGSVVIDEKRAAIRFTEANIWSGIPFLANPNSGPGVSLKAMELYMQGQFWVAIVATIQGDRRLGHSVVVTGAWDHTRNRAKTIDYGLERFRYRVRGAGAGTVLDEIDEFDGAYLTRDDRAAFADQRLADRKHLGVTKWAGDPEAFFIDTSINVGDSCTGVDGMAIDFTPYPSVQSVRYVKNGQAGGSYRTAIHMTDLRTAPEVNSE